MRIISFSMTTPQFIDGSKTVTRRFGWWNLKPGDKLAVVEKAMGLRKGEKMKRLGVIEIISTRHEPLNAMERPVNYGREELRLEGYPFGITDPSEFVRVLAQKSKVPESQIVNRIEFKKVSA